MNLLLKLQASESTLNNYLFTAMSEFLHKADALLVFKEDIESRGFWEWVKQKASFAEPLCKYRGHIQLTDTYFEFMGHDRETNKPMLLTFSRLQIKDIFLGFDNVYTSIDDRFMGLTFQPLRIRCENGNKEFIFYIIVNFNRFVRTADNRNWFELLNNWQRGITQAMK